MKKFVSSFKKHHKRLLYTVFILFVFGNLLFLLVLLIQTNLLIAKQFYSKHTIVRELEAPSPAAYPVLHSVTTPDITAQAAIIMDSDSKVVLYYKNQDTQLPTASSTKIMTALVALSYYQLTRVLTDKTYPVDGSSAGLTLGEKMTFQNALYGLLLPSGNDVAVMLSQNYPGGEKAFIQKMNKTAQNLHMESTYYEDVDGLSENNVTTPKDMALLASYAMQNAVFREVVGTKQKTITDITGKEKHKLANLNKLLGTEGVTGIKTGFTGEAGGILVTSKQEAGHMFIVVVMKSSDRFLDTEKLLQLLNNNIKFFQFTS